MEHTRDLVMLGTTPGAIRPPHYRLDELARVIEADPGSMVVISDVHGQAEVLEEALEELGLLREGNRVGAGATLVSIGDLVDGRNHDGDMECLGLADLFDVWLPGNHEAAIMGGKRFDGLPAPHMIPDLGRGLDRVAWQGRMPGAISHAGVLISHAGADEQLFPEGSASDGAEAINSLWESFLGSRHDQSASLFGVDEHRGGSAARGGALWQDWRSLLEHAPEGYRQIVGHSPSASCESDPEGNVHLIDAGGRRLGIAVISPTGRIRLGSDWVPRGPAHSVWEQAGECPLPDDLDSFPA
ncbi:metallophosphoesterase [Miltoncostaea oceani]|uniref:metallophosphoesterase n=1 Tax=Miltoncostaea oceani TaxID=2843216 RepID=UPI001C3DA352|nr:metallophosphoesterase [Miltoncostaea oceani]